MTDFWQASDAAMKNSIWGAQVAQAENASKRQQMLGVLEKTLQGYGGIAQKIAEVKGPDAALAAMQGPLAGVDRFVDLARRNGIPLPETIGRDFILSALNIPTAAEAGVAAGQAEAGKSVATVNALTGSGVDPEAALGAGIPNYNDSMRRQQPVLEGGGAFIHDPKTGRVIGTNPEVQQAALARAAAGAARSTTMVSPTAIYDATQGKASETLYKGFGDALNERYTQLDQSRTLADTISSMNAVLKDIETNKLTGISATTQSWLKGLGVPVNEGELAAIEAARTKSGKLVMDQLNAMKGAATEGERDYLRSVSPTEMTSPEGRALIERIARSAFEKNSKIAAFADELSDAVEAGTITAGKARGQLRELENALSKQRPWADEQGKPAAAPAKGAKAGGDDGGEGRVTISSKDEYDALPSGARFVWGPTGALGKKP